MKKLIGVMVSSVLVAGFVFAGCSSQKLFHKSVVYSLDKTEVDSFTSMDLDIVVAKIDIIPTADEFAIEYSVMNQNIEYSVKNNVLEVKAEQIDEVNEVKESYVKIYIPEDYEFEDIECSCEVGSIYLNDLTADNISIDSTVGNVELQGVVVNKELKVSNNVGNTIIDLENDDFSYSVKSDLGKVNIKGEDYSGFDVDKEYEADNGPMVTIESNTGDVKLA